MAYSTGTATSPITLLQSIVTFLVAQGWTTDMSQSEGTGWRAHLHKGGNYVHFRAAVNENVHGQGQGYYLAMYLGTAFSGGAAWNAQTGGPDLGGVTGMAMALVNGGPYLNFHFFSDASDNVTLVLERTSGVFVHLAFGTVAKAGSWTGGAWFTGSCPWVWSSNTGASIDGTLSTASCPGAFNNYINSATGYVRADVDTFTGKWLFIGSAGGYGGTGKRVMTPIQGYQNPDSQIPGYGTYWQKRQTSDMSGIANLLPVTLWAERDGGGASLLGSLPTIRYTNATSKGFVAGQEQTIGSNVWKFFPNFAVLKS